MKEFFSLCSKIRVGVQVLITGSVHKPLKMAFGATKKKNIVGEGRRKSPLEEQLDKKAMPYMLSTCHAHGVKKWVKKGFKKAKLHLKKAFSFS
ncbi:MAG: hypothetical protein HDQ90_10085 [Desulfovibrio sp.]|nr:hypothetical protein [Desulfovibrio sp.]